MNAQEFENLLNAVEHGAYPIKRITLDYSNPTPRVGEIEFVEGICFQPFRIAQIVKELNAKLWEIS